MQLLDNMIDRTPSSYAVLSQNSRPHLQDLLPADGPTLDEADHYPQIHQQRCRPRAGLDCRTGTLRMGGRSGRSGRSGLRWRARRRWLRGCRGWLARGRHPRKLAIAVPPAPAFLAVLPAIVRDTPFGGLALAVGFTASKGTPQVPPPGIARMGEEKYVAMPAAGQAGTQAGLSAEHSSQHPIVFLNQIGHRLTPIPIWTELENSLDLDC
jgi:hypothetical protein